MKKLVIIQSSNLDKKRSARLEREPEVYSIKNIQNLKKELKRPYFELNNINLYYGDFLGNRIVANVISHDWNIKKIPDIRLKYFNEYVDFKVEKVINFIEEIKNNSDTVMLVLDSSHATETVEACSIKFLNKKFNRKQFQLKNEQAIIFDLEKNTFKHIVPNNQ
ncbi:MAG: hypothetical protein NTW62_01180 [Candidatus Nomurabacteria bacterium]|nr:hypothetical protein [Candidatus Nomurabacteria bacterium]